MLGVKVSIDTTSTGVLMGPKVCTGSAKILISERSDHQIFSLKVNEIIKLVIFKNMISVANKQ